MSKLAGFPALHLATANGNVEAVNTLLEKGAKLEERNFEDYTALGMAVGTQQPDSVSLTLKRGQMPAQIKVAFTPYSELSKMGHLANIQLQLEYDAALEEEGMIGDPALSLAAPRWQEEALKLLLDSLTNTESSTKMRWKMEAQMEKMMHTEGEAGLLQSLSTWPTSTMADQFLGTVLWRGVERQDKACATQLLARGANPNTVFENKSVFRLAVRPIFKGNFEHLVFLEMLLTHGATPDIRWIGRSGTEMAMVCGIDDNKIDLVRLCADSSADLNESSSDLYEDPLYHAVEYRNVKIV